MRLVIQRVCRAGVRVGDAVVGEIGPGLAILVGVHRTDTPAEAEALAEKVAALRIFNDDAGRLNHSIHEQGGSVLSISQFTLYADTSRGRRPSFVEAAEAEKAQALYERFNQALVERGVPVAAGRFGAMMIVEIHNDGPVTIILDRDNPEALKPAGGAPGRSPPPPPRDP